MNSKVQTLLIILVVLVSVSLIYSQTPTANLEGKVKGEDGSPLPGATITVTNTETGFQRAAQTLDNGLYRFNSLPIGTYTIKCELTGFAPVVQKEVKLDVGTTVNIDFTLSLKGAEEITVTGEAPLLEKSESHIGLVVSEQQVKSLPLNGRQFANLGVLAGGTHLGFHPDPTRPAYLAVSIAGGSGRNVNISVDGGDNNDDTVGGLNQMYSLESIKEFKIFTQQFKAEYGRSNGGLISVVTKSGTNDPHGSFFALFRDDSLNAKTTAEKEAGIDKSAYSRQQFGGSFGGPIIKDKAHYFVAAERLQQTTKVVVDTQGILPSADGAHDLEFKDFQALAKITAIINPEQYLQIRYGYQKLTNIYGAYPTYAPNAWGTLTNKFHSFLIGHNYVVNPNTLNEAVFQVATFDNKITANSNDPNILFPNGVMVGQNPNTPQATLQTKIQLKDDISYHKSTAKGAHNFKTGINIVFEPRLENTFSGGIGVPQYSALANSMDAPIYDITMLGGEFHPVNDNNQYGIYFQDDWKVNDKLTLNLGVRYDLVTGFELDQSSLPLFQILRTQTKYNEDYLRAFREIPVSKNDTNNIQPRVGFAYDIKGDGKSIVRGGYGRYYDFPYTNANFLFPRAALGGFGVVYNVFDENGIKNPDGSYWRIGQPLPPNQLPTAIQLVRDIANTDFVVPYTDQLSLGFGHQITEDLAIDLDFVHVSGRDQYIRFRFNGLDPDTGTRRFPTQSPRARLWYSGGFHDYNGLNINIKKRFSNKFQLNAFYTISKVTGNVLPGADEFRLGSPSVCRDCAVDFKNPKSDAQTGPLNTDALHRLTLSAIFQLPADIQFSVFGRFRSGFPYNNFTVVDLNGDGFNYDIPAPYTHVNENRGDGFGQVDVRVSKIFNISKVRLEAILEIFNLFNQKNPAGFVSNVDSANYGQPTTWAGDPGQGEQFIAQVGFRIEF